MAFLHRQRSRPSVVVYPVIFFWLKTATPFFAIPFIGGFSSGWLFFLNSSGAKKFLKGRRLFGIVGLTIKENLLKELRCVLQKRNYACNNVRGGNVRCGIRLMEGGNILEIIPPNSLSSKRTRLYLKSPYTFRTRISYN